MAHISRLCYFMWLWVTAVKKHKNMHQTFLALSNFTGFLYFVLKFCPRWKIQFCQLISKTAYKMLKTVIPRILVTLDCLILFWYDSKGLVLNGYSHINMYIISDIKVCSIITEFDLMGCDSWFTPRFWISTSLEQPRLM